MITEKNNFPVLPQSIIDDIKLAVSQANLDRFDYSLEIEELNQYERKLNKNHLGIDLKVQNTDLIEKDLLEVGLTKDDFSRVYLVLAPKSVREWVKENIIPNGISKILVFKYGKTFVPYVDEFRNSAFNLYVHQSPENKIVFWKPKEEFKNLPALSDTYIPFSKIEIEEEYFTNTNQWFQIDVSKIHSLENLDPNETTIILSVDTEWTP